LFEFLYLPGPGQHALGTVYAPGNACPVNAQPQPVTGNNGFFPGQGRAQGLSLGQTVSQINIIQQMAQGE